MESYNKTNSTGTENTYRRFIPLFRLKTNVETGLARLFSIFAIRKAYVLYTNASAALERIKQHENDPILSIALAPRGAFRLPPFLYATHTILNPVHVLQPFYSANPLAARFSDRL